MTRRLLAALLVFFLTSTVNAADPAPVEKQWTIEGTERKALVQKFIEANEACKEFVQHGEFHYSNQLALAKVSSRQIQAE